MKLHLFLKISLSYALIFLISNSNLQAQVIKDYNDVISKYNLSAPDVYSFEKYELNPAKHQVGKLDVVIPIITIKTGNIEYPLNLAYNFGGIKVDQLASNVGLGWTLTSAVITRTVNQANDFDNTGSLHLQSNYSSLPSGDQSNNFSLFSQQRNKVGYLLQNELNQKITDAFRSVDFLPDEYNVYCQGYSTNFFFDTYNSVKESNPKGTKIQFTKGIVQKNSKRGYFDAFTGAWTPYYNFHTQDLLSITITTNDGIKYTFSDCDFTLNQNLSENQFLNSPNSPAQVSAWHITKIEDTKTGKKIDFIYENASSNPNNAYLSPNQASPNWIYLQGAQRSYEYVENPAALQPGCSYYVPSEGGFETYKLQVNARIDVETKRLKKIIYDEGQIVFNYNNEGIGSASGTGRNDIYNGDYISQIYLKDNNLTTVKTFNFSYDIFNSDYNVGEFNPDNSFNTFRYKRLKLTELREVGKPAHKFYYEQSINLPPVNSFSVDFLGYYNGSQDVTTEAVITSTRPNPTLYYYPNQYEKSLLPFPVPGMTGLTIPGIFNRQANGNFAKAWSLKKVEYPLGGSSEYFYESNKFQIFGQTVDGGGIRIAQQLLNDGRGNTRTINYTYNDLSGSNSGSLYSIPYFGHSTTKLFDVQIDDPNQDGENLIITSPTPTVTNITDWKLFDKSNLNADISTGSYVGYSNVTESEVGLGRKELTFTSNNLAGFSNELRVKHPQLAAEVFNVTSGSQAACLVHYMITNSGFGSQIFTNNSYKRGKLLEEKIYDESSFLLKTRTINYLDNLISTYTYTQGFTQPKHTQSDDNIDRFLSVVKNYKIAQYLPQTETVITHYSPAKFLTEITNYTYSLDGFVKTIQNELSNGNISKTEYFYPTEVVDIYSLPGGNMSINDLSMYQYMVSNKNIKSEKIQVSQYVDNILKSSSRSTYNIFNPITNFYNTITAQSLFSTKGNNPFERKINYNNYDDKNNVIQYTIENGSPVSLIWGYNKSKLIAKIENVAYATIPLGTISNLQNLSNLDFDRCKESACKEQILRDALNSLRVSLLSTNPNAIFTTYTHDPLIGVTSITDERGDTQYYIYDALERLIKVEDNFGNTVNENQYNYKPQQ